ncbi:hydroxyisourate hydrolase [Celerinatantimonas sp. YJH-8]|uniref:hydroxyisourate hydrolase n=1 Tax=Celerinatantimonas sp. YJH-8 TaxID=3228714 RepID=UPI0038C09C7E
MSTMSTLIIDISVGQPVVGMNVRLERFDGTWIELVQQPTDENGAIGPDIFGELEAGHYRLTAASGVWFAQQQRESFYVHAQIEFKLSYKVQHYHLPLFISPWAWSSYQEPSMQSRPVSH